MPNQKRESEVYLANSLKYSGAMEILQNVHHVFQTFTFFSLREKILSIDHTDIKFCKALSDCTSGMMQH